MGKEFNSEEAKRFLLAKEEKEKKQWEKERKILLEQSTKALKKEFQGSGVEVYLVGSIVRPFAFSPRSDIDIVLKNYKGDRFELWTKLEADLGRKVEIIFFEKCHFQEFVLKEGFRVV